MMFFIISKAVSLFLKPLVIIALLLLVAILKPSWRGRLTIIAFLILFVFGNRYLSSQLLDSLEYDPVPVSSLGKYPFAIVLTGITDPTMEPRDRVYINYGSDRILHTIQLYRMGIVKKILITGTNGLYPANTLTEAEELKKVFLLSSIPASDIFLEKKAKNTRENATFSKKVLDSLGVKEKSLLITSAFHMRRSHDCFEKAAVPHDVFPTNFYGNHPVLNFETLFLPSEDALGLWVLIIHEVIGEIVYKILGYT